ncbi:DUF423 domain-containing protein [Pelagicoccus mobilis]|uniref:DUF423 domain-containing protein n=1 Tax=Pelagicoccus mobilis TaxID=415221 RepID=A0A934VU41_9BACT|nr:DUF423 domain-containing protein [Pelagicoccus mobilis]MBK1880373.1 DUF423 domain-containing protein [Pelagicoccus mobilis]
MNKLTLACLFAASGIGFGAFGAHGLEDKLVANDSVSTWDTAVLYHLIHAVALFVLAAVDSLKSKWSYTLMSIGILLFSGSLYALALTKIGIFGPITPLGGLAFIAGWITLIFENKR